MSPPAPSKSLDQLRVGERARIIDVDGDDAVSIRLMEMGLIEGEEIELLGFAPLGDPIEYLIRGYRISLRAGEAKRLRVETLPAGNG
ncbi:MAG: ferrous iron transport protein A [Planctomycetaceae bacterium]